MLLLLLEETRAGEPASDTISTRGVLIQLAAPPKDAELPSRFAVAFRIINSESDPLVLQHFQLKALEEPGGLEVLNACKQAQISIAPATDHLIFCDVTSRGFDDSVFGFVKSLVGSWSLLTLQPADYRFLASAQLKKEEAETLSATTTIVVRMRPTLWQVIIGAVLGALLLALFTGLSPRLRQQLGWTTAEDHKALVFIRRIAMLWAASIFASTIFIFFTFRLKDISGPITISVNDFYGGVVLGIFGYFLADWLSSKLFTSASSRDDPPDPSTSH